MNHLARIIRLESQLAARGGCSVCRSWSPCALVTDTGQPDRPEECPFCGRCVPIETRVQLEGVRYGDI